MRQFVRQSFEGGRCSILKQYYKSSNSDNVFKIISQETNIQCNICEITDKLFEWKKKINKTFKTEYDSQFQDYRVNIQE